MEIRKLNLDLVEGIVIGIYGNWLISLVDKINFENIPIDGLILLGISFLALIVYFGISMSREIILSLHKNILLIALHYGGWIFVYSQYGRGTGYEKLFFAFLGVLLFGAFSKLEDERRK